MNTKAEIGQKGELIARRHLQEKGYILLEENWRFKKAEIDIICKKEALLIFVEVKTKSYDFYGKPEESLNQLQEARIMDAAQRYMEEIGHNWEIRFDIISIILDKSLKLSKIEHFEDAFFY